MRKEILYCFFILLIVINILSPIFAQTATKNTTIVGDGQYNYEGTDSVDVSGDNNEEETELKGEKFVAGSSDPAPAWVIERADNYIISLLGEKYFNQKFTFEYGISYSPHKDSSSYNVKYKYHLKEDYVFNINVRLDIEGNITEYNGPDKPYKLKIKEEKAIKIAKKAGLKEFIITQTKDEKTWTNSSLDSELVYGGIGYVTDNGTIYESYMWDIWTNKGSEGEIEAVFIDIESGKILRIKTFEETTLRGFHNGETEIMIELKKDKAFKSKIQGFIKFLRSLFIK